MTDIKQVEEKIQDHALEIDKLLGVGARLLADDKRSGYEILQWLTERGMTDFDARTLCVEIIKERANDR